MSITLPEVPAARPGTAAVSAVLSTGVTLADPLPALTVADRANTEALRAAVDGIRTALLADLPKRAQLSTDGRLNPGQVPSALLDRLSSLERTMAAVQTAISGGSGGTGGGSTGGGTTTPTAPSGATTASAPSWAGPVPAAADIALPTATRTYELPNLPAAGQDIAPALRALVGSSGTGQDGDRVTVPAGTWQKIGNVDWRKAGVQLICGNPTLNAPTTFINTSPTEHGIRLYADRVRLQGVSATAPLLLRATLVTARGDKNQQGMTNLLLDPGCTNAVIQDVISEGSAAAGVFCYGAVGYTLNRVGSRWSRADAFHAAAGASYGTYLDCWADGPGDDLIAFVHYDGKDAATSVPHHMRVHRFRGTTNGHGRGFAVVGARDVWGTDLDLEGTGAAGIIIGRETYGTTYERQSVTGVLVQRVTLRGCNWAEQDHGAVLLNNYSADAVVAGVVVEDVVLWDCKSNRQGVRGIVYARSGQTAVGTIEALCRRFTFRGVQPSGLYGGNVDSGSSIVRDSWVVDTSAGVTDTTKPSSVMQLPAMEATVSGTVSVVGKAGDTGGLSKVELLVNGASVASTTTTTTVGGESGVVTFSWDSSTIANGSASLALRVTDAAGNIRTSRVTPVTVSNTVSGGGSDTTPPTVPGSFSATRPASGQIVWSWGASTDDGGSGLAGYELQTTVSGGTPQPAHSGLLTARTLTETGKTNGSTYYGRVRAVDNAGNPSAWAEFSTGTWTAPTSSTGSPSARPSTTAPMLVFVDPATSQIAEALRMTDLADQITGKGFAWATDAERPIVRLGANNQRVAEFLNGRALLDTSGIANQTAITVTMWLQVQNLVTALRSGFIAASPAANNDYDKTLGQWAIGNPATAPASGATTWDSISVSGAPQSSGSFSGFSAPIGSRYVCVQAFLSADGAAPVIKVDGVTLTTSATGVTTSGGLYLGRILLGARWFDGGPKDGHQFRLAGLVINQGRISSTDETTLRQWGAANKGAASPQ